MMQTTSRFITSIVMPLSTSMLPANVLCTSLIETSGWSGVQGIRLSACHPGSHRRWLSGIHETPMLDLRLCVSWVPALAALGRDDTEMLPSLHRKALLERERRARDRIAIDEEPEQQVEIHRDQQLRARLRRPAVAGERHRLAHADHGGERRRDGEDRIEIHPGRRHALHALRQDDP